MQADKKDTSVGASCLPVLTDIVSAVTR